MLVRLIMVASDGRRLLTFTASALAGTGLVQRATGLPTADIHGPLHYLGVMDPLCGGTRAAYLLFSGRFGTAALYNPMVFPLFAGIAVLVVRAGFGMATGRWFDVVLSPQGRRVLAVIMVVGVLALEVRQQLHAQLLSQPWPPPTR